MIPSILYNAVFLAAIVLSLEGIGRFLLDRFRNERAYATLYATIIGIGIVTIFSVILNFWYPINGLTTILVIVCGLPASLYYHSTDVRTFSSRSVLARLSVFLFVAFFAFGPVEHYDTGLYHMQMVMWSQQGRVPRGLAVLHNRFGFNSFWSSFATVTIPPPIGTLRTGFLANAILMVVWLDAIREAFTRRWRNIGQSPVSDWLIALSALSLLIRSPSLWSSLSTDLPVVVLGFFAIHLMVRYTEVQDGTERTSILYLLFVVVALAVTIKLSAVILLAGFGWILVVHVVAFRSTGVLWKTIGLGSFVIVVYAIRGVLLSGAPFFPSAVFYLDTLPWSVPVVELHDLSAVIRAWARKPGAHSLTALQSADWIVPWFRNNLRDLAQVLAIGIASVISLVISRTDRKVVEFSRTIPAAFVLVAGLVFWFLAAPDVRFGTTFLFGLPILVGSFALANQTTGSWNLLSRLYFGFALASAVFAFVLPGYLHISRFLASEDRELTTWLFSYPSPPIAEFHTNQGNILYVPQGTDQSWDAPLPATPYPRNEITIIFDDIGKPIEFRNPVH